MGALWSRQEPPPDPHHARLLESKHLLRDLYPRSDGQKHVLTDGRTIGFAEYGAPPSLAKHTLVFMHGTPGTRLFFHSEHAKVAAAAAVRIIVPERPGFGLSSECKGRTLLGFADDVAELLSVLGLEKVSVMGYSAGGPYALALAKRWPLSVKDVAIVSGLSPPWLDKMDKVTIGMSRMSWWGYFVARRMPWLLPILCRLMAGSAVRSVLEPSRDDFTSDENDVFRSDFGIRFLFAASTLELYSRPTGAIAEAWDYRLFAQDWGFELNEISENIPVYLYAGEEDDKVTPNMWRVLMSGLPNIAEESHLQPEKGHLYFYELFPTILKDMGIQGDGSV